MSFTAGSVMNGAGALLNDTPLNEFTYTIQIPYLNIALAELQEIYEENNVPLTNKRSAVLTIPAGITEITFSTTPALPSDLIEIQKLGERTSGTDDDFVQMIRCEFLPMTQIQTSQLIYWCWIGEVIKFIGATNDNDVELNYLGTIFPVVTSFSDVLDDLKGQTYLTYKTAALCAMYIGENEERAQILNAQAEVALARNVNISVKGKQSIITRRRPFMANLRTRAWGPY